MNTKHEVIAVLDSLTDEVGFAEGVQAAARSLRDYPGGVDGVICLIGAHIDRLRAITTMAERLRG